MERETLEAGAREGKSSSGGEALESDDEGRGV